MRKRCSECNSQIDVCPECGSDFFTKDDAFNNPSLPKFVHDADDGEALVIKEVCWDCGYSQRKEVTVVYINES